MLELKHIAKTYKTTKGVKTEALKDINLRFPQKGMVFVLGKSGSGKSTLLNIIGGLDHADEGEIIINGKSSKTFSQSDYDSYRNTYVGFIFQEFNLMDEYTIEKNIAMALQLQQKEATHEQINTILDRLGLHGYAARYPNELSGGQKQRVAIARALIKEPEILMADEPTGALDSTTGKEIFDTLQTLSKEKLVIIVSHDRESATTYADRIIEFKDGFVESDTAPEVEETPQVFEAIHSHLPLKDSFHLGFSCLGHKKIRMIFTILLTSFALLSLALSDAVGNFNSANAQYKANKDYHETMMGVRYQYIDKYGNAIDNGMDNALKSTDIQKIIKDNPNQQFAKVYSSNNIGINLSGLGVNMLNLKASATAVRGYEIAEINSFDKLGIKDTIGTFPKNYNEVAISSYLANIIIKQGIADKKGDMQYPKTKQDIISKIELPIANHWVRISGIINQDYSKYEALDKVNSNNIDSINDKLFREFSNIVNMIGDKIFVKDGFIQSLNLPKENVLNYKNSNMFLSIEGDNTNVNSLAYSDKAISYFDGNTLKTTTSLHKNEIILSPDMVMQILDQMETFHGDDMAKKSPDEIRSFVENNAKRLIGKSGVVRGTENFDENKTMFKQDVKIIGVLLPKGDFKIDDLYQMQSCIVNKAVIDPYITSQFFVSELLTNMNENNMRPFLEKYDVNSNLYANTIATQDVRNVKQIAEFMTKVFFYVSIAFFIFAALLMMNFIIVSISYRKKDIGILRAIGARSTDVLKIFIWEGVLLAIISYVVTMIGLVGITFFVNNLAKEQVGILISPIIVTLRQPLLMLVIVALVTFIACVFPVTKIARQRPIDAIKK